MRAVAALLSLLAASPAGAQYYLTGNELHDWCRRERQSAEAFMIAMLDAQTAYSKLIPSTAGFCPPRDLRSDQARDVVCKYIEDTPQDRHLPAVFMAIVALRTPWPCP